MANNILFIVRGQSLTVRLEGEPLIANTYPQSCKVIFEDYDVDSTWRNYSKKIVFSTQVVDSIQSAFDTQAQGIPQWMSLSEDQDTFNIVVPDGIMQAPGFSATIVGYTDITEEVNGEPTVYKSYYPTNPVYVRVYPSGPINGSLPGLNPAINWADLVPEAITKADDAYIMATSACSVANEAITIVTNMQAVVLSPFTSEVTTLQPDSMKAVYSSGIFNFVEAATHTQYLATNNTARAISVNRDVATTVTTLAAMEITTATSDKGVGLHIKHSGDTPGITYGAALEIDTDGEAALRIRGGEVSIDKQLYLSGSGYTTGTTDIVFSVISTNESGQDPAFIIKKDGTVKALGGNVSISKCLHLDGGDNEDYCLNVGNNIVLIKNDGNVKCGPLSCGVIDCNGIKLTGYTDSCYWSGESGDLHANDIYCNELHYNTLTPNP